MVAASFGRVTMKPNPYTCRLLKRIDAIIYTLRGYKVRFGHDGRLVRLRDGKPHYELLSRYDYLCNIRIGCDMAEVKITYLVLSYLILPISFYL